MAERKLRIEEVALLVGVSTQTINVWYKWKAKNPNHPMAQKLPEYTQAGPHQTRFWNQSDIWSITEFKTTIPHGRSGILGEITQKYLKKEKKDEQTTHIE